MVSFYSHHVALAAKPNFFMDISLKALQEAISIRRQIDTLEKRLSSILGGPAPRPKTAPARRKGGITAAGRKRLSQLLKARWAARRKAGRPKTAPAAKKGTLTPAGRRRLSQLMKARWAARRKAAAGSGPGRVRLSRL